MLISIPMCPKWKQLIRALRLHHPDYSFTNCTVETADLPNFPQWHGQLSLAVALCRFKPRKHCLPQLLSWLCLRQTTWILPWHFSLCLGAKNENYVKERNKPKKQIMVRPWNRRHSKYFAGSWPQTFITLYTHDPYILAVKNRGMFSQLCMSVCYDVWYWQLQLGLQDLGFLCVCALVF